MSAAATLSPSLLARKGAAVPVVFAPRFFDAPAVMQLPVGHDTGQMIEAVARDRRTSVRLDPARQARLRQVATRLELSKQAVLVKALDELFEREIAGGGLEDVGSVLCDGAALGVGDGDGHDGHDAG
jgi:hypothetical protein